MAITLKTGALLVATATGSVVGLKKLITSNNPIDNAPPHAPGEQASETLNNTPETQEEHKTTPLDFTSRQDKYDPSFPEEWKWFQPSNTGNAWDTWVGYTEAEKAQKREEARKNLERLNDYTFKIFMPCGWGTGWILDYQLTKDGKYPTTWYIATNAHVAWRLRFSKNPYHQILPLLEAQTRDLRKKYESQLEHYRTYKGSVRDTCIAVDSFGHIDLNLSKQSNGERRKADVGAISQGQMEEPNLFFAAFNFMHKGDENKITWNHYSDFVVLEIKFTDEKYARDATDGFADKYKDLSNAINVFGNPVESKYDTKQKLYEAKDNYYILGYPDGAKDKWVYTTNFNPRTGIASHLYGQSWKYDEAKDYEKDKWRGFMEGKKVPAFRFKWQGETYYEFGHYLKMEHNALWVGSSGSLYVDGQGNAIATTGEYGSNMHWSIPFRSDGVKIDSKTHAQYDTPKYDLIDGVGIKGQKSSFRQQVEKYLLPEGKETWLSKHKGWKADLSEKERLSKIQGAVNS